MSDQSAVAAQAHPALAQLAALNHFRVYVDIGVVVVVLAFTNLIAHFSTPLANIAIVPVAAAVLLVLVRARGLGWAELGLGREHWRSGARYALAAVALVVTVVAVGALLPWTRPMFLNDRYATVSGALIASMVIIPLQTVIPEELAFRGVLHGALDRAWGFRGVAAAGSLLFGLWHIAIVFRADQRQRRVQPHPRRWCGGDAGRDRAGSAGHRGRRIRLHLASPPKRQPDRADRTALVAQRHRSTGRSAGLAAVLTQGSRTAAPVTAPAARSVSARSA